MTGFVPLKSPFPYFGAKSRIVPRVWELFGDVRNTVDPFFGSGALLFGRPGFDAARHLETVNDIHGHICNVFRAIAADPAGVAAAADFPVNECQLHAVHACLVGQQASMQAHLEGDIDWYDAQAAGRWLYGMACWIGSGFCSGNGPWQVVEGQLVHLGNAGQGIHRQLVHLGNAGQGIHRQLVHLGNAGQGAEGLLPWMQALGQRLRRVRVCCGDWTRVLGPAVTWKLGRTAIFMDPPYSDAADREADLYAQDDLQVAHAVRAWCMDNGGNPLLRIVVSGYEFEHDLLLSAGWRKERWSANGGYGLQGTGRGRANRLRECLWISPHCLATQAQGQLF